MGFTGAFAIRVAVESGVIFVGARFELATFRLCLSSYRAASPLDNPLRAFKGKPLSAKTDE
jgi:hypothetical protein